MFQIVEVVTHCRKYGLEYRPIGSDFIAETQDVQVFSVGCLAHENTCMVSGLSSGYYDANVSLQLERYITAADTGVALNIPKGDEVDEAVLLWGDKNFGHWIFTYLNRLPLLFHKPEILEQPLLVLDQTPAPYLEWLKLIGFHNIILAPDGTRVKRLWVPSVVHYRDERKQVHVSADAVHIFRHLLVRRSGGGERIYISRDRAKWRKAVNEEAFVDHLSTQGIRRVFMEDLSAAEQIALVSRCELIVTIIGASSPITMLAPKACKIIEIGLPGFSGIFGSQAWAQIIGQDYRRIEGRPAGKGINSDIEVPLCALA